MATTRDGGAPWTFAWTPHWDDAWTGSMGALWRELADASTEANAFHEPALCRIWAETVGAATGAAPVVGVATATDGTRVLLPWVLTTHRGRRLSRRVIEPIGQTLFGYHDPLPSRALSPAEARALWPAARRALPVASDAALFRFAHDTIALGPMSEPVGEDSPVLDLGGTADLDALLAGMSRNAREQVRRARRKLDAAGAVCLSLCPPASAQAAAAEYRSHVVPAYRALWRARPAGCLLDLPGVERFFERVVEVGVGEGWAQMARLTVGGTAVAWHVGLVHRSGWYWWLPAHDPSRADLSPGRVLMAELISRAIAERVPRLHLMIGAQRYKQSWRPSPLALRTVRWHAPGARGTMLRWYDAVRRRGAPAAAAAATDAHRGDGPEADDA